MRGAKPHDWETWTHASDGDDHDGPDFNFYSPLEMSARVLLRLTSLAVAVAIVVAGVAFVVTAHG